MTDPTGRDEVLTQELLDRGLSLAERERTTRWDWGDWAVKVAGPVGEAHVHTGVLAKLTEALAEIASEGEVSMNDLPSPGNLRYYRDAADAIPPTLRTVVPSMEAARKLAQRVPDVRDRHALIEELKNDDGIVTVRAVRDYFGFASKDGAAAREASEQRKRAEVAEQRAREAEQRSVSDLMDGEPIPDFSSTWADKLILRVHTNAQALTSLVTREGLVLAPNADLGEMYGWLLEAERMIADIRAAVQERIRDQKVVTDAS